MLPKVQPPPQLYTLTPKSTYKDDLPKVDWQLGVELPIAPSGLTTAKIAVAREPLTLDYYAGAQWVDGAPEMVHRLLIESFENSKRIIGVGRSGVSVRSDFELQPELREFQAEYRDGPDAPPTVHVRVNVKLVQFPQRRIVAQETFDRSMASPSNRIGSIVKTFDLALGKVLRDVVTWTIVTPGRLNMTG